MIRLILLMLLLAPDAFANDAPPLSLGGENAVTIQSDSLGEARSIRIFTPPGYEESADQAFDVVFVLDGFGLLPATAGISRSLAVYGRAPHVIVVGVDSKTPVERARNFTSVNDPSRPERQGGGAAAFKSFLTDEVAAYVKANYRTSGRSLLIGHSLAGLFAVDAWLSGENSFSGYVAISPSLIWADSEVLSRMEKDAAEGRLASPPFLFVSMAENDIAGYGAAMDRFEKIAATLDAPARPLLARFTAEDHVTTVAPAIARGLGAFYASADGAGR